MVRLAALALLLLSACTPVSDEYSGSFVEVLEDEPDLQDEVDDEQDPADPEDQDDVGDDDDAVDPEDPEDPEDPIEFDWDVSPPQVDLGAHLVMRLNCGMMPTRADSVWRWDGARWLAAQIDPREVLGPDYEPIFGNTYDDLEPCWVPNPQPVMTWREDGSIHFDNGNWDHDLRPTAQEDTWFGGVSPTFDLNEACLDALAGHGLTPPVAITVTLVGLAD